MQNTHDMSLKEKRSDTWPRLSERSNVDERDYDYCGACDEPLCDHACTEDLCHQLQAAREEVAIWRDKYYQAALLVYHAENNKQN